MSKGYMSIHHQGYCGAHLLAKRVMRSSRTLPNSPNRLTQEVWGTDIFSSGAPHLEAPNVLPIGLICSARLP